MLVYEFKIKAKPEQYQAIDGAIRIGQFLRNKCLRYGLDSKKEDKVNGFALNKSTKVLADNQEDFPFVCKLNSMARQASAERAWFAISQFYENCQKKVSGCGKRVKKSLSTRTHVCQCGLVLCRDHNAAINILRKALDVVGHTKSQNACGQINLCLTSENLLGKLAG